MEVGRVVSKVMGTECVRESGRVLQYFASDNIDQEVNYSTEKCTVYTHSSDEKKVHLQLAVLHAYKNVYHELKNK